ncbi:hypothetical protein BYT27DRAFT_7255648 [Phlegmacium glaucopus]|nr:hypothetical protein BYT27DRAFT_7255648 [Phlegmacium glaucopus]
MPPLTERQRMASFGSANTLAIYGGTFTEVHGIYNEIHPQESGLLALSQAISHGAIYDSAERYPAGRCHPGTREEIIKTILDWINDPNPSYDALWLYGPAGAGKSAIIQTITELLREWYKDRYAGSFFFASGVPGRGNGSHLFSTLAYQIAMHVAGMRKPVSDAMSSDLTLPTKSIDTQFKSLIVEPFTRCPYAPTHTPTIIIDGLDECDGSDMQRAILDLIATTRTVFRIPLRFLIASRPEYWIRDKFSRQPLSDITQRLELSDSGQTSQDIRKYFEDGFAEISDKNWDVMANIEKPWPPTEIINRLVYHASGQFVYASTVLKFIGAEFCNPQTQLDIIFTVLFCPPPDLIRSDQNWSELLRSDQI